MKQIIKNWLKDELKGFMIEFRNDDKCIIIENDDCYFKWFRERLDIVFKKNNDLDWENFYSILGHTYNIMVKAFSMNNGLEVERNG